MAEDSSSQPPPPALSPPVQMTRPGVGNSGRRVELVCNHFSVSHKPTQDIFQYDVCIMDGTPSSSSPDKLKDANISNKNLTRSIISQVYKVYGAGEFGGKRFAYDGEKGLYTSGALPFRVQEFSVILDDEAPQKNAKGFGDVYSADDDLKKKRRVDSGKSSRAFRREFKVKIEFAATIKMTSLQSLLKGGNSDTRAQDALRVLDIVMRQHAAAKGYLLIRDNYFSPMFGVADLGEGVQVCQGFHVSFRPSMQGLSLNLDVATTTLFKPMAVLDFLKERFCTPQQSRGMDWMRSIDWDRVRRILKGVKVISRHTNMIHRIIGFSDCSCAEQKFAKKIVDGEGNVNESEHSVEEYMELKYNIRLNYPFLPCIAAGRQKRPTYVPIELCEIMEGQRYTKTLSSTQRQRMIDEARQGPEQRKNVVQKAMDVSEYNSDGLLNDFNVKVDGRMRRITGRLLDTPALKFGNIEEIPQRGKWNYNNKKMANGVEITCWVVLNFDSRMRDQDVDQVCYQLANVCNSKGMKVPRYSFVEKNFQHLPAPDRVNNILQEVKKKLSSPPVFMLCFLPVKKTSDLYAPLKKTLETKLSVVTQCIAPRLPVKDQYLTNVALKINAKLGGYNSWLTLEFQGNLPKISRIPTVIFGLDVSHGSPGHSDSPSIAAVVASREWPNISKYSVRLRAQSRKVEMIAGLYEETPAGGMIVELLKEFHSSCRKMPGVADCRPKQIIIFRDGVSESQFEQVLREEYLAFKKAFSHVDKSGTYDPRITLIVVQKRHHTRFFPANGTGNIPPGTIVDVGVCHPRDYDFYLSAHNGIIGTTRPTHYHVLVDENGFTVDELQQLTHSLCYTYARSTTAVSTVAPVAYAHLAATHARNFLDHEGSETSSMTGRSGSAPVRFPELHRDMRQKMFYC